MKVPTGKANGLLSAGLLSVNICVMASKATCNQK
jgi:hypothetical protein